MKIALMATGGIGGFLGVKLAAAGCDVAAIARGAHLDAIRANGLTLEKDGARATVRPWRASADAAEIGPVDIVVFGVKGDDLDAAGEACRPLLGADTAVVPFLNGVEAAERLQKILPADAVAKGVARVSAHVTAPGVIAQTGEFATFQFAEADNRRSERLAAFRGAMSRAGVSAPEVEDIDVELWLKFILFAAVSGVTAAGRCRIADIHDHPPLARLFREVIGETAALARARGVAVPDDVEATVWETAQGLPPALRASTAVDLERGKPLEVAWITGAVVRMSEALGRDAPANRALYALLSPYRAGRPSERANA